MRASIGYGGGINVLAVFLVWGLASTAYAHPDVDEGRRLYGQADLDGAIEAFSRAEASHELTREELMALLETRSMVHLARGDQGAADRDLASLHALDPDHEFGRDVPPDVVEGFRALPGERLSLEVDSTPDDGGVTLSARARGDPGELVQRIRIHARVDGGDWETAEESETRVDAADDATVEYYAEAIGPGGAVVATEGSDEEPRVVTRGGATPVGPILGEEDEGDGSSFPVLWVVSGGAAAAAIVVAIVLLSSSGGDEHDTQPAFPMVEF